MKLQLASGTTGFLNDAGKWICTGSQFGRRDVLPDDQSSSKLRLNRLPFVDVDYDRWGAYWGSPANVWCAWDGDVRVFVRADDRAEAKKLILTKLPTAKFHRLKI
jgi:hypothetical protein